MNLLERGQRLDEAVDAWFRSRTGRGRLAVLSVLATVVIAFQVALAVFGGWFALTVGLGGIAGTAIGLEIRRRRTLAAKREALVDVL